MASDKFREQLRDEVERWRSQGIISAEQARQLAERYEFAQLDGMARDRFVTVVLGIGSVLLGLGVITFVAANWQAIPRELKLLLLLLLFVGVNVTGFYLWNQPPLPDRQESGRQRLGQGLLLLGALILGANLALMGQMFHINGSSADLCIIWGLAVLGMAYGLRLTSLGMLAILLTGIGYWIGVSGWDWNNSPSDTVRWVMHYMPLIAGLSFVPLAYWCRSKWVFGLGAIAFLSALEGTLSRFSETAFHFNSIGVGWVLIFTLPPAILWSYDDRLWQRFFARFTPQSEVDLETQYFRPIAQGLSLLFLTVLTYSSSFHYAWEHNLDLTSRPAQVDRLMTEGWSLWWDANLLFFVSLTVVQWLYLARPRRTDRWGLSQSDGMMLGFLGVIAAMTFWHWHVAPIVAIATFLSNVLLFLLAVAFMRDGLADGQRRIFWSGLTLVTLQILSRLLEYETALLLKSVVFLLCGVGVIVIGLWFERYVRILRIAPEE
ncbi:MAG: DUF2157 domain-containing protein [Timaviella obliquedivisa GSE-PSE-MK23-08B]|jgi:uncharacterized membrane protein|nr:DUF2157 domain-containing protein [Timaviella obliquedivisa GSE-PSE-MK23-08B]